MKVPPSASPSAGTGSAVIVCVERDPFVRDLESFFLTEAGFGVTFADDGLQAGRIFVARDWVIRF